MADLSWLEAFDSDDLRTIIGELLAENADPRTIEHEWKRSAEVASDVDLVERLKEAKERLRGNATLMMCGGPRDGESFAEQHVAASWVFNIIGLDKSGHETYKLRTAFERSDGTIIAFYDYVETVWS